MVIRTSIVIAFGVSLVAGCASADASTTPGTTSVPTASASDAPAPPPPPPTPTPSPSPSDTATPLNAGPLTVPGEYSFGPDNFGGVLLGQSVEGYGLTLGNAVMASACGDAVFPSLYPIGPDAGVWELFLMINWDDPSVDPDDWTVRSFLLVTPSTTPLTQQAGPVGPRGLRLGTPESTIEAMFPAEAAASTQRSTTYYDFATDAEATAVERVFTIADVGGGPMVITTADGYVATLMWGNPAYVSAQRGFLRCFS